MTPQRLEEIKSREERATATWEVGDGSPEAFHLGKNAVVSKGNRVIVERAVYHDESYDMQTYADIDFIAHSRQDIPDLLAYIGELQGAVKEIMKAIPLAEDALDKSICELCPGNTYCNTWKCDSCPPVRLQKLIGGSGE